MATANNVLYSPYGAFELKSKYQRNLVTAILSVVALVAAILVVVWLIGVMTAEDMTNIPEVRIKTIAELGPPPTLVKKPPQVQIQQTQIAAPKIGIPKPVADEEVSDAEDVTIASRDELAEIQAPDIQANADDQKIVVDINEDEYLPKPDEFVPVEVLPEMIHYEKPEYPRLAKQAGLTGTVWVKVLVDKDGSVRQAMVGKSSGTQALDDAAVAAASKNKFKPGIQNGRPVACWATYRVDFSIDTGQ
ncbi:hypothetical protein C3F09_01785 [candidate division GN15 bacterium]|uniref:TonB C-terminal domain-containing protein n=1 Tax=candidate division GN15 bacterium TaxID=2072418 RepID=A0A855X4Q5_9BACT|nr:MAG: hypothetical protein C3F09_01785 [candidate division GN15 bacterium]